MPSHPAARRAPCVACCAFRGACGCARRCLPIIAQPGDKAMAVVQYVHKRNSLADVDETGDSQASATSLHAVLLALCVASFHEASIYTALYIAIMYTALYIAPCAMSATRIAGSLSRADAHSVGVQVLSMYVLSLAVALRNLKTLQDAWHARGHGPPKVDAKLFDTLLISIVRQEL